MHNFWSPLVCWLSGSGCGAKYEEFPSGKKFLLNCHKPSETRLKILSSLRYAVHDWANHACMAARLVAFLCAILSSSQHGCSLDRAARSIAARCPLPVGCPHVCAGKLAIHAAARQTHSIKNTRHLLRCRMFLYSIYSTALQQFLLPMMCRPLKLF